MKRLRTLSSHCFLVFVAFFLLGLGAAQADKTREECLKLLEDLQGAQNALNQLDKVELPSDRLRDFRSFIAATKSALSSTGRDTAAAAKKIEDQLKKSKSVPKEIEPGLKDVSKGLKDGASTIGEVVKLLDKFDELLDRADRYYVTMESGSAADQMRNLAEVIEDSGKLAGPWGARLGKALSAPVREMIPLVAAVEKEVKEKNKIMMTLWQTGSGEDIGIVQQVYIPAEGPRAALAKVKIKAQAKLDSIKAQLDALGCIQPGSPTPDYSPPPSDPCFDRDPNQAGHRVNTALENARRAVVAHERQAGKVRGDLFTAQVEGKELSAQKQELEKKLETEGAGLKEAKRILAGVESQIRAEKSLEVQDMANAAATGSAADKESYEASAERHRTKRVILEQVDLVKAKTAVQSAQSAVAKAEVGLKSGALEEKLKATTKRVAELRVMLEAIRKQIAAAVQATIAEAWKNDNWDALEESRLDRCRGKYFSDQSISDSLSPSDVKAYMCKGGQGGKGFVQNLDRVTCR